MIVLLRLPKWQTIIRPSVQPRMRVEVRKIGTMAPVHHEARGEEGSKAVVVDAVGVEDVEETKVGGIRKASDRGPMIMGGVIKRVRETWAVENISKYFLSALDLPN
jgi:hypothetical protein